MNICLLSKSQQLKSQGYRPMLISTGLSGNEAYSPLNFLYTWNWSPLKPNTFKCIYFNENYSKIKWTMKFCENELLYNCCIIVLYVNNSSIVQCILKYNFLHNFLFVFFCLFKEKQSALLSYIMRKQSKTWMSKDGERGVLAERMKNTEIEKHYLGI